jgi:hypothetical protein
MKRNVRNLLIALVAAFVLFLGYTSAQVKAPQLAQTQTQTQSSEEPMGPDTDTIQEGDQNAPDGQESDNDAETNDGAETGADTETGEHETNDGGADTETNDGQTN